MARRDKFDSTFFLELDWSKGHFSDAAPVTLESLASGVLAAVIAMFLPVESLGQSLDDAITAQPKGIVDQMEQNELEGKKEKRPTERY